MPEDQEVTEDPALEGGQVEGDGAELTELTEFDITNYADQTVVVKVDGEDVRVPLKEALAGYQRQADYTRKTQGLAAQTKDVQWAAAMRGALENDPAGTLQLLQERYGVKAPAAATESAQPWASDDEQVDPRLASLSERLARFEEKEATDNLHKEIARLSDKYGDDFDANEVVAEALKRGSTSLEDTFKSTAFDRVVAKRAAAQAEKARVDAKRDAQVVSGGSSTGAAAGDSAPIRSISDAWHASKRELAS